VNNGNKSPQNLQTSHTNFLAAVNLFKNVVHSATQRQKSFSFRVLLCCITPCFHLKDKDGLLHLLYKKTSCGLRILDDLKWQVNQSQFYEKFTFFCYKPIFFVRSSAVYSLKLMQCNKIWKIKFSLFYNIIIIYIII